jgi:hypothetical protein
MMHRLIIILSTGFLALACCAIALAGGSVHSQAGSGANAPYASFAVSGGKLTRPAAAAIGTFAPTWQTAAAPVSAAARVPRKVVMFDLFQTGLVKPCCLFLHADTPTVIFGLKWRHWGGERAVAHGRWDGLNCGPCGPNPIRVKTPVIVTAKHLVKCKPRLYAYRTVLLTVPDRKARTELGFPPGQMTTNIGLGGCNV